MLEENKQSRHGVVLSSKSGWLLLREVLVLLGEGDCYFLKSLPVIHGLHRKLPYNLLPVKDSDSHQGNFYSTSACGRPHGLCFQKLFEGFTVVKF